MGGGGPSFLLPRMTRSFTLLPRLPALPPVRVAYLDELRGPGWRWRGPLRRQRPGGNLYSTKMVPSTSAGRIMVAGRVMSRCSTPRAARARNRYSNRRSLGRTYASPFTGFVLHCTRNGAGMNNGFLEGCAAFLHAGG